MLARDAAVTRALLCLAALLSAACGGTVAKAGCATAAQCDPGQICVVGSCQPDTTLCPTLAPSFASINTGLLQPSCYRAGSANAVGCHSGDAASGSPDFKTDPFHALLGQSGTGAPALEVSGRPKGLLLVKPGDPTGSFLLQKLKIQTATPALGVGMPPEAPRSVCDNAAAAISAWIAQGAMGP
jgi:hypothetical protein